jgi:hypothetical protein
MNETFRLRKAVKYQGIVYTLLLLAILAGCSSIFFPDEPTKHGFKGEHSVAVVGGMGVAVFGAMLLMSIYLWAAYYVEPMHSGVSRAATSQSISSNGQTVVSHDRAGQP